MDLNECYRKGLVKKTKINKELIKSLIEMSDIKENTVNAAHIDDSNISAYVSMAYESLREVLESICILNGYKVISRICLGKLLKDIISNFDYYEFDRMRYIRNGINYYGTKVDFDQGKEIIKKIFKMKIKLVNKYIKDIY